MRFFINNLFILCLLIPSVSFAQTSFDQAIQKLADVQTERWQGVLTLDDQKKHVTRTLSLSVLRLKDQTEKSLIQIQGPGHFRGYRLLSESRPSGLRKQWLYLPGQNKTKRLMGGMQQARFLGSEFRYEDFLPIYKHQKVVQKTSKKDGVDVFWVGKPQNHSQVWVNVQTSSLIRIEVFEKGIKKRTLEFLDFKKVSGHNRSFLMTALNHQTGKRSTLRFVKGELNLQIDPSELTPERLKR